MNHLGPISTDSFQDDEDNAIIDVEEDYKIPISNISTGRRSSKSSIAAPISPAASSDDERLSPDSVQVNINEMREISILKTIYN